MNIMSSRESNTNTLLQKSQESDSDLVWSSNNHRRFQMQLLTLDSAVSPLLSRPAAPFDKTERKRAHTSALYYSECFHRGIQPMDADSAAQDAQDQYDKWWIERSAKCGKRVKIEVSSTKNQSKCRRISLDYESAKSSNGVSIDGATTPPLAKVQREENRLCNDNEYERGILAIESIFVIDATRRGELAMAKGRLIEDLKLSKGDVETPIFLHNMGILEAYYRSRSWDGRGSCKMTPFSLEGNWLTISKPTYDECRGRNENNDLVYTLGRLTFGMFRPTNLECSVQASFNTVRTIDPKNPGRPLHVPKKLMKEIHSEKTLLRTYDIVVAISIEPGQNRRGVRPKVGVESQEYSVPRPIKGILTNQAYVVPDPSVPNRLSIWFSGGSLEVQDEPADLDEWLKVFDSANAPERNLREYAKVIAARILLGALVPEEINEDGKMSFELRRPIGGHRQAYCDILYMDEDLRIMQGHHGSVYVCTRVPGPDNIEVQQQFSSRRSC